MTINHTTNYVHMHMYVHTHKHTHTHAPHYQCHLSATRAEVSGHERLKASHSSTSRYTSSSRSQTILDESLGLLDTERLF
jgi:hypothetical protein